MIAIAYFLMKTGPFDRIIDCSLSRVQLGEPFIQKYLKNLAVHVCTVPITRVVSVAVTLIGRWVPEIPALVESSLSSGVWRVFLFIIFTVLGLIITEVFIPEPELIRRPGKQ